MHLYSPGRIKDARARASPSNRANTVITNKLSDAPQIHICMCVSMEYTLSSKSLINFQKCKRPNRCVGRRRNTIIIRQLLRAVTQLTAEDAAVTVIPNGRSEARAERANEAQTYSRQFEMAGDDFTRCIVISRAIIPRVIIAGPDLLHGPPRNSARSQPHVVNRIPAMSWNYYRLETGREEGNKGRR